MKASTASHFRTVVLERADGYFAWCACGYNGESHDHQAAASRDVIAHRAVCPYKKRF